MTMHEVAGANNEVRRLRGRVSDRQGDRKETEETLMALPFRLSGMGILSHQVIPWLCQQPTETSDRLINSFLPLSSNMDASQEAQPKSQHERCKQLWEDQRDEL